MRVDKENLPQDFKEGKFIVFLGGGRASGKTTLLNHLFKCLEEEGYQKQYIGKFGSYAFSHILDNPIAHRLREYFEGFAKGAATSKSESGNGGIGTQILDTAMETAMSQGSPIIVDYHMDDNIYVDKVLKKAREHGYETIMLTPHISAETYFHRVQQREERTGRPFNTVTGLATHKGFSERIDHYLKEFDLSIFLSNETENGPPTPIAVATPSKMEIFDEEVYRDMRRKAEINIHATSASELYTGAIQQPDCQNICALPGGLEASNEGDTAPGTTRSAVGEEGKFVKKIRGYFLQDAPDHNSGPAR